MKIYLMHNFWVNLFEAFYIQAKQKTSIHWVFVAMWLGTRLGHNTDVTNEYWWCSVSGFSVKSWLIVIQIRLAYQMRRWRLNNEILRKYFNSKSTFNQYKYKGCRICGIFQFEWVGYSRAASVSSSKPSAGLLT